MPRFLRLVPFLALSLSGALLAETRETTPARNGGAQAVLDRAAKALGGWAALARVESVRAVASVESPRGTHGLELRSARGGRFVMRQLRDGKASFEAFISPGAARAADGSPIEMPDLALVLGHDFAGIALDPRMFFSALANPRPATLAGASTTALSGRDPAGGHAVLHFDARSSRLAGFELQHPRKPGVTVVVTIDGWSRVAGVLLPSAVTARDDLGSWVMRFASVTANDLSPSDFEPGSGLAAPGSSDNEAALLRLHEEVLEGHRARDARWLSSEGEEYVVANRGEISTPSLAERTERFADYLGKTRFDSYRDLRPPVVRVSADGSLGWVIAVVGAEGTQVKDGGTEPLSFVSAWIELYARTGGTWRRVGNVSNFRP